MKRRPLIHIALCIPLGVLTSYLVAWAIGIQHPGTGGHIQTTVILKTTSGQDVPIALAPSLQTHATDVLLIRSDTGSDETVILDKAKIDAAFGVKWIRMERKPQPDGTTKEIKTFAELPAWLSGKVMLAPVAADIHLAQGWPLRCVRGVNDPISSTNKGLIPVSKQPNIIGHRVLAYHPIWPGLIYNTLIYASIWLAVFTLFAIAKQARRKRKGLCPRCAYDLKGTTACPECGHNMPATAPPVQQ